MSSLKVVSTNIGARTSFRWNGLKKYTGINKMPVAQPIYLGTSDVKDDVVIERKVHGGPTKACYAYSADHYDYWKNIYPDLDWHIGMFGENLTVQGLDEYNLFVGNVYQLGNAKVRITEPRQPCYKFGHKMGDQGILKRFVNTTYSGSYLGVVEQGEVKTGDEFILIEENPNRLSIAEVFQALYLKDVDSKIKRKIENETELTDKLKTKLVKRF